MGLIATFVLVAMALMFALHSLADWMRPPAASDRWYVRELKAFLSSVAAFLITWVIYQALARRFLGEP